MKDKGGENKKIVEMFLSELYPGYTEVAKTLLTENTCLLDAIAALKANKKQKEELENEIMRLSWLRDCAACYLSEDGAKPKRGVEILYGSEGIKTDLKTKEAVDFALLKERVRKFDADAVKKIIRKNEEGQRAEWNHNGINKDLKAYFEGDL